MEKPPLTLARGHRGVPGEVAEGRLAARGRALANEAVAAVAGPAHHTVDVSACLAHDETVLWRVWSATVHG